MWSLAVGFAILASSALGEVELRIVRPNGSALADAKVHATNVDPAHPEERWVVGHTDAEGLVRLRLDPRNTVHLAVKHWIYDMIDLEVHLAGQRSKEVRLPEPPWALVDVSGRVLSPAGAPVAGASLLMRLATGATTQRRWTTLTDADGRFEVADVPEGAYRVELQAPGLPSTLERAAVLRGMPPLELRFSRSILVRGRLVGDVEPSSPATLASVSARAASDRDHVEPCSSRGTTTFDGPDGFHQSRRGAISGDRFEIRLPPGSWRIRASGWEPREVTDPWVMFGSKQLWSASAEIRLEEETAELELDLEAREPCEELRPNATAPVRGRVYDEASDRPIPDVWVIAGCRRTTTGADGRFELPLWDHPAGCPLGLRGLDDLEIQPSDEWARRRIPFPPAGDEWIEVPVRRVIGVCYELRWSDGRPFPYSVYLFEPGALQWLTRGDTDAEGAGCVAGLPAGDYEIEPAYQGGARTAFSIPTETLHLTVPLAGSLRIRAPELTRDFGLRLPAGALVRFDPVSDPDLPPIVREANLSLWLGGIPPGRWRVTVRAPDWREWSGEVDIVAEETTTLIVR